MEPFYTRGDLFLLNNRSASFQIGQIIAFPVREGGLHVVHRLIETHERESGKVAVVPLTHIKDDFDFSTHAIASIPIEGR
jgi:hypothetical protein